jgi:hypothetical protein
MALQLSRLNGCSSPSTDFAHIIAKGLQVGCPFLERCAFFIDVVVYIVSGLDSLASMIEHAFCDRDGHTESRKPRATGAAEVMGRKRRYTVALEPLEAA